MNVEHRWKDTSPSEYSRCIHVLISRLCVALGCLLCHVLLLRRSYLAVLLLCVKVPMTLTEEAEEEPSLKPKEIQVFSRLSNSKEIVQFTNFVLLFHPRFIQLYLGVATST